MSRIRLVRTVAVVAAIASALVVLLQIDVSDAITEEPVAERPALRSIMMTKSSQGVPVFGFPTKVYLPTDHASFVQPVMAVDAVYRELEQPELGPITAFPGSVCSTRLSARRAPAAMVRLSLRATCQPNAPFVIRHGPLAVTVSTDDNGEAELDVPALSLRASFSARFQNVEQASADVIVPEVRAFDRVAVQWRSAEALDLHAFVDGAFIGGPGHVWTASPHTAQEAREGGHGFLVEFGNPDHEIPHQAEIFTFPTGVRMSDDRVDLRLSNLLNHRNCGREVDMTIVEVANGGEPVITSVSPTMPDCGQLGFVVLLGDNIPALVAKAR